MITGTDIDEIAYDLCRGYGVPVYLTRTFPVEAVTEERVVIIRKAIMSGGRWHRCMVEVNWCVPDVAGEPDLVRLKEIEIIMKSLKEGTGMVGGDRWRYRRNTSDTIQDSGLKIHYANVQLLFELLNVTEDENISY